MSGSGYQPSKDLPIGIPHGTRGEPTGRPIPSEFELNEAAERHRRDEGLSRGERVPWWKRALAGRLFRR